MMRTAKCNFLVTYYITVTVDMDYTDFKSVKVCASTQILTLHSVLPMKEYSHTPETEKKDNCNY